MVSLSNLSCFSRFGGRTSYTSEKSSDTGGFSSFSATWIAFRSCYITKHVQVYKFNFLWCRVLAVSVSLNVMSKNAYHLLLCITCFRTLVRNSESLWSFHHRLLSIHFLNRDIGSRSFFHRSISSAGRYLVESSEVEWWPALYVSACKTRCSFFLYDYQRPTRLIKAVPEGSFEM